MKMLDDLLKRRQVPLRVKNFCRETGGTTAIEYSLIAGLIMVAIVGAVLSVGDGPITAHYNSVLQAFLLLAGG